MKAPDHGAVVLSLDFELHWGVFDRIEATAPYRANLLGARDLVPRMLDLFHEYDIAATWATVGLLFAASRAERERHLPNVWPRYQNPNLDPYAVPVGDTEADDPLHYAPGLVQRILDTPRQELATHTFGHIYCTEPGLTAEAVRADLEAAQAIAAERGARLSSIVFPRNQANPAFLPLLREAGIVNYRGAHPHRIFDDTAASYMSLPSRLARMADLYVPFSGYNLTRWEDVPEPDGLCNIPSSRYIIHWRSQERRRVRWACNAVAAAAKKRRIVHFWWHPHDFGVDQDANLRRLRTLLETAARYRDSHGLQSMTMAEVGDAARAAFAPAAREEKTCADSTR